MVFLTSLQERIKLQDFEKLNCVSMLVTSSTQISMHIKSIVVCMQTFVNFGSYNFIL